MSESPLRTVLARIDACVARDVLPIVVFDLDSTLFSTAARNFRILTEFVETHGRGDSHLTSIFASLGEQDMRWNVRDDLRRHGFADEALLGRLRDFWASRFFSDRYLLYDRPMPGAVAYVHACHDRGALVYYLTGRHVGGMEIGTVRALTQHGFPFWRGRCVVHLKPSTEMGDRAFKDDALADVRSYRGEVVATFENEPGNANMFLRGFPGALHFLMLTIHSPDAEAPLPELIACKDFTLD